MPDLDPVYTRTDPKWYGSISDPYQFLLAFTLDRIQISTPSTLGTELEQFHSKHVVCKVDVRAYINSVGKNSRDWENLL